MRIYENNPLSIGNTPLVKLNKITKDLGNTFLVKIEGRNPAYSVKCRLGAALIWDALERGVIKDNTSIIEPTSGNTGIGLAYAGAALGIKVTLVMPDTMSVERRKMMSAFGAEFILTPGAKGMKGAVEHATELAENEPDRYYMPQQFKNPANPAIHRKTTGPEIWDDTDGEIDAFVAGIGTGGTISGVSQYIKLDKRKSIISIGVEPEDSPVIQQTLNGNELQPGPHKIQGIGAGFIPETLDLDMIDKMVQVGNDEAIEYAKRLTKEEGIISGISSGAAVAAAIKAAKELEMEKKNVVIILPDSGERYLSMDVLT
ncbi:cysteine synthase A [Limisalsivibrio acetivorans]|uniref:cysteine synthase A n=1 Tax=Limisalsivibrio acetivorans TaxID=1304888 RepID=UPI0003B38E5D|nr:cysteine synthase A [Limisalsivibrio acetivorans]